MSKPVIELAPCPFCGGEADLRSTATEDSFWFVECLQCGASAPVLNRNNVDGWNNRSGYDIAGIEGASGLYYTRMLAVANGEQKIEPLYRVKK